MALRPTLGFIGAGKVGQTLARLWSARGYEVAAVASRSPESASRLAAQVGAKPVPVEAIAACADLILLTVPDDQISSVTSRLAGHNGLAGRGFLHTSGAHDAEMLAPLESAGGMVGSLHPAFPFADVELALTRLPGSTFAIEASAPELRAWASGLVEALDGRLLTVSPGQKALYHAALALASNYTVTLYALAERLLLSFDADREAADGALNALVAGTVENLHRLGVPDALTGPLARGDLTTVEVHIRALANHDPALARLYIQLAQLSLPLLQARGLDTTPFIAFLGGLEARQE